MEYDEHDFFKIYFIYMTVLSACLRQIMKEKFILSVLNYNTEGESMTTKVGNMAQADSQAWH